jgi:hypothetical protein
MIFLTLIFGSVGNDVIVFSVIEQNAFMRLAILLVIVAIASCKKAGSDISGERSPERLGDRWGNCPETGTIKKGSDLGLWCKETLFIVKTDNTIVQPVISQHLMDGFSEGDQIIFGYREVFVGMISCGENIITAELLCVEESPENNP